MGEDLATELQETLGGVYTVERELGGGGMSRVFVATEVALRRRVVVKVLPRELAARISAERFRREIRFAATLQHPHIVPLLTASAAGEVLYYTMPFVDGESLRDRLARDGTLGVAESLRIATEVADALAFAHRRGLVHRDVKPANILLSGDHALVTDFGIARAVSRAADDGVSCNGDVDEYTTVTEADHVVGTPAYMSPEQARGQRDLGPASDVYSIGCVLHEMLLGVPPTSASLERERQRLPSPLLRVLYRALAPRPDDRYPDAAALGTALADAAARTARTGRRRGARVATVLGAVALGTAAGAAAYAALHHRAPSVDADLLAVEPFHVASAGGAVDARWGEDLAVILSTNLDGAGPIRVVPPSRFLRRWTPRGDLGSAADLGRLTGAGLVVTGRITPLSADSVRVSADLYDVRAGRSVGDVAIAAANDARFLAPLSDSLTYAVLRALARVRVVGAARRAPLGTAVPLPALRAYLEGERSFRETAWDSALVAYRRAVESDSTFALAMNRMALVLGWQRVTQDSLVGALRLRAGALNRGLGPHDSLLVLADSIAASLDVAPSRSTTGAPAVPNAPNVAFDWTRVRRLLGVLAEATQRYPDSPLAWYGLGEARMHYGGPSGVMAWEARDAFDRAIVLDSAFTPAYVHPIELAAESEGARGARPYADAYAASHPSDEKGIGIVAALLASGGAVTPEVRALLDAAPGDALFHAWIPLRRWADSTECAVMLLRTLTTGGRRASYAYFGDSVQLRARLAAQLAFRGHLAAAVAGARADPRLWAELARFGGIGADTARSVFARWLRASPDSARWAIPWWAERGDTASLRAFAEHARTTDGLRAVARPYLALARHDTVDALRLLAALPDSACGDCFFPWLTHAELLARRGRDDEALAVLGRWYSFPPRPYPSEVVWTLLRATVAERRGDRRGALQSYCAVVATWARADASLGARVAEARRGIARLGGVCRP